MDSSRLREGVELIQNNAIKRQKRTKNMPKRSQKGAKMSPRFPKLSPGAYKNDTKTTQEVQKWIPSANPNFFINFYLIYLCFIIP